jgi:glutamate dehydrogenase
MFEVSRVLRHACYWLIDRYGDALDIVEAVEHLKSGIDVVFEEVDEIVVGAGRERQENAIADLLERGVPEDLARQMAGLLLTRGGLDIADLSTQYRRDALDVAVMYAALTQRLGVVWLTKGVEDLAVDGRWQAMARANLRHEFFSVRRELADRLLGGKSRLPAVRLFENWAEKNVESMSKFDAILQEMQIRGEIDFATLSVAAQELRRVVSE